MKIASERFWFSFWFTFLTFKVTMEILSEVHFIRTHISQLNPQYLTLFWLTSDWIFGELFCQCINLLMPSPLLASLYGLCSAVSPLLRQISCPGRSSGVSGDLAQPGCSSPQLRARCSPSRAGISQQAGKMHRRVFDHSIVPAFELKQTFCHQDLNFSSGTI